MVETYSSKQNWPKERKLKPKNLNVDDLGFSYTPDGSFFDPDDEYFNRFGFDIHGGWYSKQKEYIPGPDWISSLGCYDDEKEKYMNIKYDSSDGEDCENFNEPDFGYGDPDLNEDFEGEYFDNIDIESKMKELNLDTNILNNLNTNQTNNMIIVNKENIDGNEDKKEIKQKKTHRAKKKK